MKNAPVLIVGAGPTGLVLALWLTKAGVPVRIIDKADRPGATSRATVVHARTLEYYRQLGIDHLAIDRGVPFKRGNMWVSSRRIAQLPFGDAGRGLSPYPYILIFPQDLHEQLLNEQLSAAGVEVERSTELISFEETATGITAQLRAADGGIQSCEAAYLAGCDGAHSGVRHRLGTAFPGGTYENVFYVADLKISGPLLNGELNMALDDADLLLVFPMLGEGRVRLIGSVKDNTKDAAQLQWGDVNGDIIRRLHIQVEKLHWFSAYHVHHRVAAHFRQGRAFLLGDAGHIHSPVGGQGMNTGIGDAVNLAWKLAAVLKDSAPQSLLDTYEPERIAFARKLVATTDRAFTFVDSRGAFAAFVRTRIAPLLLRLLFHSAAIRRAAFRVLSQTKVAYRQSALSKGKAGRLQGGDRLPWLPSDNFRPLSGRSWQLHCYGTPAAALDDICRAAGISLQLFPWSKEAAAAGMQEGAAYLVRPDGYIGLAAPPEAAVEQLTAYLRAWRIGQPAAALTDGA